MEKATVQTAGFAKTLRLPQIVALYIGAVIGSGVLLIPGLAAEKAGPASILAWLVMSILVLPMALTMGLLSARYPSSGGVSTFVRTAYGDRFGNIVGWFFLLSVPIGAPILSVTGANYLAVLLGWGDTQIYAAAALILTAVLIMNVLGMHVAARVQTIVVALIISILIVAVVAALPHASAAHFTPFAPNGWLSVVQAAGLLFWCFIGWEAVTHLSEEFVDPAKNAIRGVLWSAGIVALLYFAVAFMTVATHSYGAGISAAALSVMVQLSLGPVGGWIVAVTALFICIATTNAYIGAAARIAYALAQEKIAPRWFGLLHAKYRTPIGGLLFLSLCFGVVLTVLYAGVIDLARLIELPTATFFATYIGGCLAGIRLLRNHRLGRLASWTSLVFTVALYPFLGWSALYPLVIAALLLLWQKRMEKRMTA
ncbi:amino acid permease [Brevibacillus agri]|uniref:Amino acid permease n=2 Tax=Brevibacillus agri TaxID=51101 RepID=A0A3M8AVF0_9BACL|nr:amino acid permease [Brevibacillus agri]MBY0051141.1 amino acid permease [Brevibacillus agri]QAV13385.1 amino acid permease [Brevibacillus agri]RNB55142.1 amino acid permease [Brevibacillus agri]GED26097.1 amino acid permease [Brevibacillus agri]